MLSRKKGEIMDTFEQDLMEKLSRGITRRSEQRYIEGIKTIKLELMLLRERDRVRELENGEWAELEEIDVGRLL
jgi:hypothetical protein